MNIHSTSTLNSSSTLSFKIYSALPYLLVIALSSILCFGFCRFVVNKEIDGNVSTTRILSSSILMTEHYIDSNLKCASTALEMYLEHNPVPKTQEGLQPLAEKVGVSGYNIFDKGGKRIYASRGGCPYKPKGYKGCTHRITEDYPFLKKTMTSRVSKNRVMPFAFLNAFTVDGSVAGGLKSNKGWYVGKQLFSETYMNTPQLATLLKDGIVNKGEILNIKLSTPNGVIVLDTCNINNTCNVDTSSKDLKLPKNGVVIDEYDEKPIVNSSYGSTTISLPFGGLQDAEVYLKDSPNNYLKGQANDAGQYFYVMNITFDKTALNKQLAMIITGFIVFTLISCIAIYYINKSITQSNHLADVSERTADKVTHLCNTRLGEVRRYVTKIVGDSMRVKNMNKDLPEEMVELLDRAFREVDEKCLIDTKKEGTK